MVAVVLACALQQGTGSAAAASAVQRREEVVVTAERLAEPREGAAGAVSVLTREEIARLPVESLAELLEFIPGFQVLFRTALGGLPIVSSRGFFGGGEAEYALLLVDGVPVGDPESGLADWRRVRATDVERVEVLHGPGSSVYGDTALAGVVQVFTRASSLQGTREVTAAGGSFGTLGLDGVYRSVGRELRVGGSATASRSAGFRAHSAVDEGAADVTLGHDGPKRWSLVVSGSSRDRDDPGPLVLGPGADRARSDPLFRFDHDRTRRGRAALSVSGDTERESWRLLAYGATRDTRAVRTLLLAPGLGDRAARDLSTDALGGSAEGEWRRPLGGGEARLRTGAEAAREWLDTEYRAVGPTGEREAVTATVSAHRDRTALFATADWHPSTRVRVASGLRWDRIAEDAGPVGSNRHSAWSPRGGVNVRLGRIGSGPVFLSMQASRAFKAATLDQVVDPRPFPDFRGGTFTISNPTLSPQRAFTVEGGLNHLHGSGRWQIVAYRTAVDDEIDFDPATFRYTNIGRTSHVGLEAGGSVFDGKRVSPQLNYSWSRVEAREPDRRGFQLKNVPRHIVRGGVSIAFPARFRTHVQYTWMGGRYLDDANRFPLRDTSLLDLRVERPLGRGLRARLDLLNLTDSKYSELGFPLSDFRGTAVAYEHPAPGVAARFGILWSGK